MNETEVIRVRYWAAARSAAGSAEDVVEVAGSITLSALTAEVVRRHASPRFADVIGICSILVGDRPVATEDPATVDVQPGQTVEFLPPFAGG